MRALPLILLLTGLLACTDRPVPRFDLQPAEATGVDFVNEVRENDTVNILQYEYLYNGGGVGVGDFNRDGRYDLFFTGNLVSSELYLQQADGTFRKVTGPAGLTTEQWCAGVLVGDIDGNGYEDLYVSILHPADERPSPNLLFLNDGPQGPDSIPRFREVAAAAGVADPGYGTQAALFDLDRDGRLDLYVLNNSLENYARTIAKGTDTLGRGSSVDRVYRNVTPPGGDLRFELLDARKTEGWGLGLAVQDFDGNGYSDLYVGNDFMSNDFLLLNEGGDLRDRITASMPHQSKNTMGVDVADLDNDGRPEILTVDMLPDDNLRRKTMFADIPFSPFAQEARAGYNRQYVRNALQYNNGDGTFSDVAFLAGVAATDWSWAPLLADFDNDGLRDVFISNGYPRDITDRDFMDYTQEISRFGSEEARYQAVAAALLELDGVYQQDFIFQNRGGMHFRPTDWLPDDPTYANGAAIVDLDNDGDLDLVTNNINQPARIYYNRSREQRPDSTHYLSLILEGPTGNPDALGARVYLAAGDLRLYAEQQRQRGYLSTVDPRLHFGLGARTTIDSLLIIWPDGRRTVRTEIAADQPITCTYAAATAPAAAPPAYFSAAAPGLVVAATAGLPHHRESVFSDFDRYALALRDRSHDTPALATDRSGRLYFGGAAGQEVSVWDVAAGTQVQGLPETRASEATALLLVDYDGDGDDDLYVGNGSSEFVRQDSLLTDFLYRNDAGTLVPVAGALPSLSVITGATAAADIDGDGDQDLFIGARAKSGSYPYPPLSYVLDNVGGRYVVRDEVEAGMVTGAVWQDLNGDGRADLATVGEYSALRVFLNEAGRLVPQPVDEALTGWWYCLVANDLDGDGDTDLLAGNYGGNGMYRATADHPLTVTADDYDGNGAVDPIITAWDGTAYYPVHPRNTLGRQLPGLKQQIPDYATYGSWTADNMPLPGPDGITLEAREFRTTWFENDGAGHFTPHFLPWTAQTAPVRAAVSWTLPDGRPALLAVQNDYATEILGGMLDAGNGFALTVDAAGRPEVLPEFWSVRGDARSVVRLDSLLLVGVNDGPVRAYRPR
ncbi:CRTAC1 family protein [Lewinella sp. IMCC34183]|uniref:CRTAC1 family protein n=1 Tax=Lewinella sp. IMCC34183 TaxID=2248762 RepID=UPI000E22682D|nr:CRTAC1 family protein [Lewinella sp. IMCC34183]